MVGLRLWHLLSGGCSRRSTGLVYVEDVGTFAHSTASETCVLAM